MHGGAKTIDLVNDIRQMLGGVELENFPHRILFMSMSNDTEWNRKGLKERNLWQTLS